MTDEIKNQQDQDDEIDLIALAKTIWEGRKLIIICVLIFMFLGVTVALLTPKKYTATTTMVPQVSDGSSKMGGLSSLAAMAGFNIDLSKGNSELSPMMYPQIISSAPFQLEIMNTPFKFPDQDKPVSLYSYYTDLAEPGLLQQVKKYSLGLPFVIVKAIKGEPAETSISQSGELIAFSEDQEKISKLLNETILLDVNSKEGFLTLSVEAMDARLAAEIAQKSLELLQSYITTFKVEKASAQLNFIEERYKENQAEFEAAQAALADFRDKNKNVISARARTQEERLQSEYQLAFDVYSQLAQQLEQARIQVKEDTPLFSVIKPVTVPVEKSSPNRPMILIIWTFMGGVLAIGWIFGKEFLETIQERWKEDNKKDLPVDK